MEQAEFKCKTCGAPLTELAAQSTNGLVKCPSCFNVWTIPKKEISSDALSFLHMGEHELDTCKFDDAYEAYKKAAELDPKEPEAYFGMALASLRVQYLKDETADPPRLQPICHEISEKRFSDNKDFKRALEVATEAQKAEYIKKAKEIDDIRVEFEQLKKEGVDYDCFICVKVSEENTGTTRTTQDSYEALRLYNYLKSRGYAPFYSEEEIKARTGSAYEALILYALYTSECMLLVCFDESYLQTKWVKNEYTRFSKMIASEDKERNSITFVYRGKPIERLPGQDKKLQGIDLAKPDAYSLIEDYVRSFAHISLNSAPEITRKDYAQSGYKKKQVVRKGVEKRQLVSVGGGEVKISNRADLDTITQFMNQGDFDHALKYCDSILEANPANGEVYWLHFLSEQKLSAEGMFASSEKPVSSYENFEKAIAATADAKRRQRMYELLFERVKKLKQINDYEEYIILPDSKDADIAVLTDTLFDDIIEHQRDSEKAMKTFDGIIKTVTETDKYVAMNLKFAQTLAERAYDKNNKIKYYKNILEADAGHGEALYWNFVADYSNSEAVAFGHCAQADPKEIEDRLFAYGFNAYAAQKLFEQCLQIGSDIGPNIKVFDFVLSMIPKKKQKLFVTYLKQFVAVLFDCRQFKYIERYNEMLIAADQYDYEAYFNRVMLKNQFNNPLELATVADILMDDEDYMTAVKSYNENNQDGGKNPYMEMNSALLAIAKQFDKESIKFLAQKFRVPKEEISSCMDRLVTEADNEAQRLLGGVCKSNGVSKSKDLFTLRTDVTGDQRLKTAFQLAKSVGNSALMTEIGQILSNQKSEAQKNVAHDMAVAKARRKAVMGGRIFNCIAVLACALAAAIMVFIILGMAKKTGWQFWLCLFNGSNGWFMFTGVVILIIFVILLGLLLGALFERKYGNGYGTGIVLMSLPIVAAALIFGMIGQPRYVAAKNGDGKYILADNYIVRLAEDEDGWSVAKVYTFKGADVELASEYAGRPIVKIGDKAFQKAKLSSIVMLGNVEVIGEKAFYKCKTLSNVILSDDVITVGKEAFKECNSLSTVVFPKSLITIKDEAFYSCGLKTLIIPYNVTDIGSRAFANCQHLESVFFDNTSGWEEVLSSNKTRSWSVSDPDDNAWKLSIGTQVKRS